MYNSYTSLQREQLAKQTYTDTQSTIYSSMRRCAAAFWRRLCRTSSTANSVWWIIWPES